MSRRKSGRTEPRKRREKRAELGPARTFRINTTLLTALAVLVSAVLCAQWASPRSMLGAMRRIEYLQLASDAPGSPSDPRWKDVAAARDAALRGHPKRAAHFAVAGLLRSVVDLGQRKPTTTQAVEAQAAVDPTNRVARLAHAVVADYGRAPAPPIERFDAMRRIVDAPPPATTATLYNAVFRQVWRDVLNRYFRRSDVAASLVDEIDHYEITDHYSALPVIRRTLVDLSRSLRAEGYATEANKCMRWLALTLVGLMRHESDGGTRLLCADLLARSLPDGSDAAAAMRRFRQTFHARAGTADMDLADQSFSPRRSVAPEAYHSAIRWLIASIVPAGLAAGAALLFVGACVAVVIRKLTRKPRPGAVEAGCGPLSACVIVLASAIAMTLLTLFQVDGRGVFSQAWGHVLLRGFVAFGALITILLAAFQSASPSRPRRYRLLIPAALAAGVAVLPMLSPPWITHTCRGLDLALPSIGSLWLLTGALAAIVVIAVVLTRPDPGRVIATAAVVWCVNSSLATVNYVVHHKADKQYQRASVAGHVDEVAARLGADWQDVYLKPVTDAFNIPGP
ncbi:MAG: hypothetical protein ACE5F9_08990 [Phycisphaerae bacterium]